MCIAGFHGNKAYLYQDPQVLNAFLLSPQAGPTPAPSLPILPTHETFALLSPFKSLLGWGCRAQLTGQSRLPWWPRATTATTSSKQMGNGWPKPALCSPPRVKCEISAIYTSHPLQTLAKWLFPYISLTASRLCALSKLLCFLDFWGCLWMNPNRIC